MLGASWRIVADGVVSGLGGGKIASRRGAHQEGKVLSGAPGTKFGPGQDRDWNP
jgi:hypothetical protein